MRIFKRAEDFAICVLLVLLASCGRHDRNSALYVAASQGDLDTVKRLVQEGVDVNSRGKTAIGMTALGAACNFGERAVAEYLLEHGADPNIPDAFGRTPIEYSIGESESSAQLVKLLLRYKANPRPLKAYEGIENLHPDIKEIIRGLVKTNSNLSQQIK